jgi:hypothetical protein
MKTFCGFTQISKDKFCAQGTFKGKDLRVSTYFGEKDFRDSEEQKAIWNKFAGQHDCLFTKKAGQHDFLLEKFAG